MNSKTVIYLKWKLTNRVEIFVNLGKIFSFYKNNELNVSRDTLNRKDLFDGYENDIIELKKMIIK